MILLYEGTYDIFLEILKKEKGVEIYLEHNLDKISILIEDESIVIKNKIIRDDVYDLVVKDTREKVGVTNLVGLAERYDALNKELCSSQTQDSLHEEINASLGILHDMHIEEFVVHNISTINTIQGSEQEEYDATKSDDNEDFVVDCELEFDDDEELQFARRAIRNPRKKISFDVNSVLNISMNVKLIIKFKVLVKVEMLQDFVHICK